MSNNMMKTGDRVTILPNATWGASDQPVNSVLRSNNEPLFLSFSDPDGDGDLHVKTADGVLGGYVHERFVKPYVEPVPSSQDYTFDPGGSVIDFASIQEEDTIAAKQIDDDTLWFVGKVNRVTDTYAETAGGETFTWRSDNTEIRLLNRPEVKVDRVAVQVTAVTAALSNAGADHWDGLTALAAALVKAGVTAQVFDA